MASNANMYRIGDYVYFEISSTSPFQVRRIEELNKTPNGNVEAKVMCFFRRRDLPTSLTILADRHQSALEEEVGRDRENLSSKQKHLLQHRELFLSRQVETLPATHIRGKCSVTLLNETESLMSYLEKDDTFFYSLVYDPQQKTLLADRGEIRVGQRYQVEKPKNKLREDESDERNLEELETLIWTPHHGLTDKQIDQFLVISRSVGTFARALDCSSSVKQPSLHMSAAASSRDVTLFHAMDTLHDCNYNMSEAVSALVPSSGPLLCRDEMEEWSASEANLFEEALEKYGKDFADIRTDFLPWKTLKNIVEYYYMWKTTDRYVQQKRVKAAEAETKLKQVYIPIYNKPSPAALPGGKGVNGSNVPEQLIHGKPCESCLCTASTQWYAWTSSTGLQARLCHQCWNYWRKYGGMKAPSKHALNMAEEAIEGEIEVKKIKSGPPSEECEISERAPGLMLPRIHKCGVAGCGKDFKMKNQLIRHYSTTHGFPMRSGSPRPVMKTRTAFYLHTTPMTRIARRMCSDILRPRHATRAPFWPVNILLIKQECQQRVTGKSPEELKSLITFRKRRLPNAKVSEIAHTLGQPDRITPNWLILTDKSKLPQPIKEAYPKPPKAPDGSLIYERVPERHVIAPASSISPSLKKRAYDEVNGMEGPVVKRPAWDGQGPSNIRPPSRDTSPMSLVAQAMAGNTPPSSRAAHHINGSKPTMTRIGSRKQIISWMDAPDDLYFRSTEQSRKLRKTLSNNEMRRLARSPCKKVINKNIMEMLGGPVMPAPLALGPGILTDSKLSRVWRSMSPDQGLRR